MTELKKYQSAVWSEPIVLTMGSPGRRGQRFALDRPVDHTLGELLPAHLRREKSVKLPELSEFEVLRHYEHLSQQTLGMMGVSLFGTCTMKYNPRVNERLVNKPEVAEVHPLQDPSTFQGTLEIVDSFDHMLREVSGMDRFVFQAGGGADAAYLHMTLTRAYFADRGELGTRNEIITTIQSHPCNPATAAAAGFSVITLPLEEDGYPSTEALRAALSDRTAALVMNNPDDIGIYNPRVKEWVDAAHDAGALCFYDHANFNGVMTRIRARELGFDACMFMLHKTFGSPKSGSGGPAIGAYGCTDELAKYLPGPLLERTDSGALTLVEGSDKGVGRIREFMGNLTVVIRAYCWSRSMGIQGLREAANLSVLANNYMETRILSIPGVSKAFPDNKLFRLEMTRYSLEKLTADTGVTVLDIQNRMTDFGVDAPWLSHDPWFIPEPITPEAGELWSREDLDHWIDALAQSCEEAYAQPELVKSAPHNQAIHKLSDAQFSDPDTWATTWRSYTRKYQ